MGEKQEGAKKALVLLELGSFGGKIVFFLGVEIAHVLHEREHHLLSRVFMEMESLWLRSRGKK